MTIYLEELILPNPVPPWQHHRPPGFQGDRVEVAWKQWPRDRRNKHAQSNEVICGCLAANACRRWAPEKPAGCPCPGGSCRSDQPAAAASHIKVTKTLYMLGKTRNTVPLASAIHAGAWGMRSSCKRRPTGGEKVSYRKAATRSRRRD